MSSTDAADDDDAAGAELWYEGLWERWEKWATELGVAFEDVLEEAEVADPRTGARASQHRIRKGGAPRIQRQITDALMAHEKKREQPTDLGQVFRGIDDFLDLGRRLAAISPTVFLQFVGTLRKMVSSSEEAHQAAQALEAQREQQAVVPRGTSVGVVVSSGSRTERAATGHRKQR